MLGGLVDVLFIFVPALSVVCFALALWWRRRSPLWLPVVALIPALAAFALWLSDVVRHPMRQPVADRMYPSLAIIAIMLTVSIALLVWAVLAFADRRKRRAVPLIAGLAVTLPFMVAGMQAGITWVAGGR